MPRPVKTRKVEFLPEENYFIPLGKQLCVTDETMIKVEELEAMRLKDIEELSQEECAERMDVSRQTFQNIIDSARKKVASALIEGKAIRITGGSYITYKCSFKCRCCGKIYNPSFEHERDVCPNCGSKDISCCRKDNACVRCCRCEK